MGSLNPESYSEQFIEQRRSLQALYQELCPAFTPRMPINLACEQGAIEPAADVILARLKNREPIEHFIGELRTVGAPPGLVVAGYDALSRCLLQSISEATHLSVIVPLYQERRRAANSRAAGGEALIRNKSRQLDWLTQGTNCTYKLIFVDDGCPKRSGELASRYIRLGKIINCEVLNLQSLVDRLDSPFPSLKSASESNKGGAVLFGLWHAHNSYEDPARRHVSLYTDADLMCDLRMSGLLLHRIVAHGDLMAMGNRYPKGYFAGGPQTTLSKAYGYYRTTLRAHLFPELRNLSDTQVAFKAFDAPFGANVATRVREFGFAFDMDLLRVAQQVMGKQPSVVPAAFIHSLSESKTAGLSGWHRILKSMANAALVSSVTPQAEARELARRVREFDADKLLGILMQWAIKGKPFDQRSALLGVEQGWRAARGRPAPLELSPQDTKALLYREKTIRKGDRASRADLEADIRWLEAQRSVSLRSQTIALDRVATHVASHAGLDELQTSELLDEMKRCDGKLRSQLASGQAIHICGQEVRYEAISNKFWVRQPLNASSPYPLINSEPEARVAVGISCHQDIEGIRKLLLSLEGNDRAIHLVILSQIPNPESNDKLRQVLESSELTFSLLHSSRALGKTGASREISRFVFNKAPADFICFVDDDTTLAPNFFKGLRNLAKSDRHIGAVGPLVRWMNPQPKSASPFQCYGAEWPNKHFSTRGFLGVQELSEQDLPRTRRVDYIVGPAIMLSTRALRVCGSFDPTLFCYGDELDLGLRLRAGGFASAVTKSAVLYHSGRPASGGGTGSPTSTMLRVRNALVNMSRHPELRDAVSALRIGNYIARQTLQGIWGAGSVSERLKRASAPLRGIAEFISGNSSAPRHYKLQRLAGRNDWMKPVI